MSETVIFYFGIFAVSLLALGIAFTVVEFNRMSKSPEK
jgi:hypothetical protein